MANNSFGGMRTTVARQFAAYDRAPACLRRALRDANYQWDANGALALLDKHRPAFLADFIRDADAQETARQALSLYGPSHPQAIEAAE